MADKLGVTFLSAAVAVIAFGVGGSKCYAQRVNTDQLVRPLRFTIQKAINDAANRGDLLVSKIISAQAYDYWHRSYNVMVCNVDQNNDASQLRGVIAYFTYQCSGIGGVINFGVWFFESGMFVLRGDGGYENWAFSGNFKRTGKDGKTVVFSKNNAAAPARRPAAARRGG
jgi:hypothetical protein